jgi:hypothetical protein
MSGHHLVPDALPQGKSSRYSLGHRIDLVGAEKTLVLSETAVQTAASSYTGWATHQEPMLQRQALNTDDVYT